MDESTRTTISAWSFRVRASGPAWGLRSPTEAGGASRFGDARVRMLPSEPLAFARYFVGEAYMEPKTFVTSQEAADLLGLVSAQTVENWLEGGRFPGAVRTP